ncbi:hypothetical protein MJO28_003219 [Puccinia striiformis f. sp. tritici]|uniref:Uncharacterized protein n=1 Tax=Puccinia striiformis f. sp. tritici TaxID=168172 RepID=A0ACC0ET85_9BASI|nr:hypothetical protein MJO28_003219 [Puccinia striiformis f. sp. tritici]
MPMFLHSAEVAIDNVFILRSLDEIYKLCMYSSSYLFAVKVRLTNTYCEFRRPFVDPGYAERVGSVLKAVRHPGVLVSDHRVLVVGARARQALARWVSSAGSVAIKGATMTMHFHHLVLISLFCLRASCGITGSPKSVLSDALDYDKLDAKKVFSYPEAKLTEKGRADAARAGITLKTHAIRFDCGYTSELIRAQETYGIVMNTLGHKTIPVTRDANLNALNYGILGGFVKEDAGEEFGEENVKKWYGSEDALPPGGETVKDCYQRAKSYYNDQIKRDVLAGKNIIVVAHRHPILGVLAGIEGEDHVVDPEKITNGAQVMYELDSEGRVLKRTTV